MRVYQETYGNFLGIFARNLARIWVQSARKKGARSKKIQENLQKLKAHGSMAQTHGSDGSGSN